jgi:hypothetical protein
VAAGASSVIPDFAGCITVPAGAHTLSVQLLASGPGVVTTAGTIGGVGLPADTVNGPRSDIPFGAATGLAMTPDANTWQNIVNTSFDSTGAGAIANSTDNESSTWVTIDNPTGTAATISLRGTMNGLSDSDDPALNFTVSAKSQLTVAGVLLCNGEPTGVATYGMQINSPVPGIQVQASQWRGIAWAAPATP